MRSGRGSDTFMAALLPIRISRKRLGLAAVLLLSVILVLATRGGGGPEPAASRLAPADYPQALAPGQPPQGPNVVLIVADDLGWSDLPAYGNAYHRTPNIDVLAREGMRLTSFYAYPVCTPSRAALMTGLNPARLNMTQILPGENTLKRARLLQPEPIPRLPGWLPTLGRLMKNAGYSTGYFGKWHLGGERGAGVPDFGYDRSLVTFGLSHIANKFETGPRTRFNKGDFLGDVITDQAIEFIDAHKDGSFFLEIQHFSPHIPLQAKQETIDAVAARYAAQRVDANPVYGAMIEDLDANVGRILTALEEHGLEDETLVIFTSDNGGLIKSKRTGFVGRVLGIAGEGEITSNAPLRGQKATVYEGGVRVPFIVRWPGSIPAGGSNDTVASLMDIHATLAELVGAAYAPGAPVDGASFLPSLLSGDVDRERPPVFIHFPHYNADVPATAIRKGDWKYIFKYENQETELYNLSEDIGERANLAEQVPLKREEMDALLRDWLAEVNAPMPTPNANWDPEREREQDVLKAISALRRTLSEFRSAPEDDEGGGQGQ